MFLITFGKMSFSLLFLHYQIGPSVIRFEDSKTITIRNTLKMIILPTKHHIGHENSLISSKEIFIHDISGKLPHGKLMMLKI